MASRNSVKPYINNSFYHVYNRGVEKRNIFLDQQDYAVFLSYLKTYVMPKDELALQSIVLSKTANSQEKDHALKELRLKNYSETIELVCYALMPNHFHLLIRQSEPTLDHFMNSVGTRYGMYFNRKYKRTGVLFQDVYKAVLVETDEQLLHLSRYIHLNPVKLFHLSNLDWDMVSLPFSLPEYLMKRTTQWIKSHYILNYFLKNNPQNTYANFMDLAVEDEFIANIALDLEDDALI